ncbi:MAG: peptidase M16 [Candidatus Parcubacteria bacterium]|nr:MAG: peptidase M16 [Candidatus Parcubacteria bacterium]
MALKHNFERLTLPNGLRLLVIPQKKSFSVAMGIFVEAGTSYEKKEINGISHFLEHMCFKGTHKRPTPFAIASEFEGLGAINNAFTSRDYTGYWANVSYNKADEIFDLMADMYLDPLFDEKEIEKERGVIIEEINMYEDKPQAKASQTLERLMYGDQPAGWDVAGTKENIKKINRQDFLNFRNLHYCGAKTVVVMAGRITPQKAKKLVADYFSKLKKGRRIPPFKVTDKQKNPALSVVFKDLDQTHFILAFKAFNQDYPWRQRYALMALDMILGGGMSSRLFQKVREEMGAAYYVGAHSSFYKTHGYFEIFAGVNHKKTFDVLKVILEEARRVLKEGVTEKELKRIKNHWIGGLLISLETPLSLINFYGEQEIIRKKIISPQEIVRRVKSLTREDIKNIAHRVFKNEGLNLAVVGPYKESQSFKKILSL